VIIEDGCFIGSRCIVVEGVRVEKSVLGANVYHQSTKIIDVSGDAPVEYKGRAARSSDSRHLPEKFPAGESASVMPSSSGSVNRALI
jgi:2,3,4,5-tetrahydropyridine-2-carboxylate N-succinyltransferase